MFEPVILNKLFVSYNWGAENKQKEAHIPPIVDELKKACDEHDPPITLIRDSDAIAYRDIISDYMRRLSHGRCVIVIISDGYLKSENCMRELVWIHDHREFKQRIFPIVLDGTKLDDPNYQLKLVKYWKNKAAKLNKSLEGMSYADTSKQREREGEYSTFARSIGNLSAILADMNNQAEAWHRETGACRCQSRRGRQGPRPGTLPESRAALVGVRLAQCRGTASSLPPSRADAGHAHRLGR